MVLLILLTISACTDQPEKIKPVEKRDQPESIGRSNQTAAGTDDLSAPEGKADKMGEASQIASDFAVRLDNRYLPFKGCENTGSKSCVTSEIRKTILDSAGQNESYIEVIEPGTKNSLRLAVFSRDPDSVLIALNQVTAKGASSAVLEFSSGKWADVSLEELPEFSTTNIYEPMPDGKTIEVYAKKIVSQTESGEVSKKGERIYKLRWNGKGFLVEQ